MRRLCAFVCSVALLASGLANAAECPGNPETLGTSRVLVVDPSEHGRLGTMQYRETLPLQDREVVLTFDDGPLPPYTNRVLDILAAECVKATYFLVGRQARAFPELARAIQAAGHTVGTHSQNHPLSFHRMPVARAAQEIEDGIASVAAALGDPHAVAPFFRIPGLLRAQEVETYLAAHAIMTWSADFPADDWKHIKASEIMSRALDRLEAKGRGVLLLHDIQPATVIALPGLLKELKARGYRIVHVQPATADRPKTPTTPSQWVLNRQPTWPQPIMTVELLLNEPALPAPDPQSFGFADPSRQNTASALGDTLGMGGHGPASAAAQWPAPATLASADLIEAVLPAPRPQSFGYTGDLRPLVPAKGAKSLTPLALIEKHAAIFANEPAFVAPAAMLAKKVEASESTFSVSPERWPLITASMPRRDFP
jgi:peptidoglycan/xylan/chitin deacetylase (PgdA/CDA1 family)